MRWAQRPAPRATRRRASATDPGRQIRAEGWRQYIDSHPELAAQGFQIFTEVDVDCSQRKVPYVRAEPSTCAARRSAADSRPRSSSTATTDRSPGRQA